MSTDTKPKVISTSNPMVDKFYDNTQSNIIRITEDKLKVILLENKDLINKKSDYITPLILLITLILAFCTTEFKEFATVPKEYWGGFFMFCTLGSIVWLIKELKKIKKALTVEELTEKIRIQNQTGGS
jgi:hypothetical protein|tara:strand:+ start:343 stop:726 length:384 start_codon:yes stop_codon:yes gene_type:complete